MKTKSNNEIAAREYVGGFSPFLRQPNKHSLVVSHRQDGKVALTIFYQNGAAQPAQSMQSIMLNNEQKVNLAKFLLEHRAELWKDV